MGNNGGVGARDLRVSKNIGISSSWVISKRFMADCWLACDILALWWGANCYSANILNLLFKTCEAYIRVCDKHLSITVYCFNA